VAGLVVWSEEPPHHQPPALVDAGPHPPAPLERNHTMIRTACRYALPCLVATCLAVPAAAVVQVGSLAESRMGGWTLDGNYLQQLREKLLDPANFGVAGTYGEEVAITDVADPLTGALLEPFDVFFIGYLYDLGPGALTATELARLDEWVRNGGSLIATCDRADHDAVCEFFGYPVSFTAESYRPTTNGLAQTPFNGPFGVVDAIQVDGAVAAFDDATGTSVLAREEGGARRGTVLLKSVGRGRILFVGDVDTMSGYTLSSGALIENENDQFAANLFAFAADFCGGPVLCLGANQRFAITVDWATATRSGVATGTALGSDTGHFWFFRGENVELIVKVINGCDLNNHFWVFAGGLTNVQVTITVTDRSTGSSRVYYNLQSTPFEPVQDTEAFATCVL
jgi:hypothetical protein